MLDVLEAVEYENSVSKKEFRSYLPYNDSSFNYNDEIRINVNNLNFVYLNESYLHIELKVNTVTPAVNNGGVTFIKNFIPFLFSEIRLEMNGILIDSIKSPGICSTIMKYITMSESEKKSESENMWTGEVKKDAVRDFIVPLRDLLNFVKDYKKLIIFSRLELILVRSRTDDNSYVMTSTGVGDNLVAGKAKITIDKIRWFVPHIHPEESIKLKLLKILEHGRQISMPFRSIEYHENPGISGTELSWQVKTTTSHPLFIIVGFQTERKDNSAHDSSVFDHCNVRNCRLYLNSDVYPYEGLNLDYEKDKFAIAYRMMQDCRRALCDRNGASITREEFKANAPIICFDVSHFDAHVKNAVTDIKVEVDFATAPPARTTVNLLIVSEQIIHYNPFTNIIQKE